MRIEEEVFLVDYGMRRKRFVYDHRVHHSYVFVAGHEVYTVIVGSLLDEATFTQIGYEMPPAIPFPINGMAEVCLILSTVWGAWLIFVILNSKD